MPLAAVAYKLAPVLTPEILGQLSANPDFMERLATEGSLIDLAAEFAGIIGDERAYLELMPVAINEAVRVTIRTAIQQGKGVQVQFSPAYDFGLRIWDYGQAISVHLEGPYTKDTQPARLST